ncbi:hydrolase [Salmonella enterica subsp. indica]|nr:hydrolase [Salmonella enterica subsp. indica]
MAALLQKVQETVITLENNGVNAALQDYPGLGHGPMFNASFRSALLDISREQASPKSRCH